MKYNKMYLKKTEKEFDPLKKASEELFSSIYELTLKICGKSSNDVPVSDKFFDCWNEILEVWRTYKKQLGYDVIYAAVHHITWAVYHVEQLSEDEKELLHLVEKAILEEGYAYERWSRSCDLDEALSCMLDMAYLKPKEKGNGSACFGKYIYLKAFCRIKLKNRNIKAPLEGMGKHDMRVFNRSIEAREYVRDFEFAIKRLLPDAKMWPEQDWLNEKKIYSEIKCAHGVDYCRDFKEFDTMIEMFCMMLNYKTYDSRLIELNEFPKSMASCFWKLHTDKKAEAFFWRMYNRCMLLKDSMNKKYSKATFLNSWVYKQFSTGAYNLSIETKKKVFEMSMGIL